MRILRGPGGITKSVECRIPGTRWCLLLVLPLTWLWGRRPDRIVHVGPVTVFYRST